MIYNVLDYGAVGDGAANDAGAIQAAIDACSGGGGGRVVLPSGKVFRAGSIILRSNVEFHLETGTVLKASEDLRDYALLDPPQGGAESMGSAFPSPSTVPSYVNCEYDGKPRCYFIYAKDAVNLQITGFGRIDGSEEIYHGQEGRYHIDGLFYPRIPMVLLEKVEHLTIRDVTMANCGFWTLHMAGCEDVRIDGIRILNSLKMANSDGIDPDHCRNVRIINCHIECADDCIVLKNTRGYEEYGPCENILISGCTLVSTSAAVKFGTESESPFRNIIIENCVISRSNRGISLQLRDKGCIENVLVSNIHIETRRFSEEWWGRAEPVSITVADRKEGVRAGHIRNVCFRDVFCEGENGIFLWAEAGKTIENIRFENVSVFLKKKSKWTSDSYDLRPCRDSKKVDGGIYAFYAHNIQGLELKDIRLEAHEDMGDVVKGMRYCDCADKQL